MAPYRVVVIPPDGTRIDIVIPYESNSSFRSLLKVTLKRASQLRPLPTTEAAQISLHLGEKAGFVIDPDDVVSDVITAGEIIFVVFDRSSETRPTMLDFPALPDRTAMPKLRVDYSYSSTTFQIRVINPELAQNHEDIRATPLLKGGASFSEDSTLEEIKGEIAKHLGMVALQTQNVHASECNCELAEKLVKRGIWQKVTCSGHQHGMSCSFDLSNLRNPPDTCASCSIQLSAHSPVVGDAARCSAYVLVRSDLSCRHAIHSKCVTGTGSYWECPDTCYSVQPTGGENLRKFLSISGSSNVEWIEVERPTFGSILSSLKKRLGADFESLKTIHTRGDIQLSTGIFVRLPVISICAKSRHERAVSPADIPDIAKVPVLDLHTAEGPIETSNLHWTARKTGISSLVVNGVLSLYAIERKAAPSSPTVTEVGKNAMFKSSEHWETPSTQSERGTSAFLSCLRVFAHAISAAQISGKQQNEVLSLVHQLTRFLPAVRAIHILMDGRTLRPNECAAIVQSISALLHELVPKRLIENDIRRVLEGTRLVLGFILYESFKNVEKDREGDVNAAVPAAMPYLESYRTVDLRDAMTLQPVHDPIQTSFGLLEAGSWAAHRNGGILDYTPNDTVSEVFESQDPQALRVAMLSGGLALEATYYDTDSLNANLQRHPIQNSHLQGLKSLSKDLPTLAALCEKAKFVVVHPRLLSAAQEPALTLDRDGLLSVYVGKAACAPPDRGIKIFRPLSGEEENIDVNIVTQLIEPIVLARDADGTSVFDLFSTGNRVKEGTPTELLMFCVDCSESMDQSSNFKEINETEDEPAPGTASLSDDITMDDLDESSMTFSEMKEWVLRHHALEDMLGLIRETSASKARLIATQITDYLRKLTSRELAHYMEMEKQTRSWASRHFLRSHRGPSRAPLNALRKTLTGLNIHAPALTDFLIFKARGLDSPPEKFVWEFDHPIPIIEKPIASEGSLDAVDLSIPFEILCPISHTVFEDPVVTSDNFTYERRAIERWFQIRKSSPSTGLSLEDVSLRRNQVLYTRTLKWIQGDEITQCTPPPPKKKARIPSTRGLRLNFVTPTGNFLRNVASNVSLASLHMLAFRGMRGAHDNFSLYHDGRLLEVSNESLAGSGIASETEIVAHLFQKGDTEETPSERFEEMCLVKIYHQSTSAASFSYWVPQNTPQSMDAVLFRIWRYMNSSGGVLEDLQVMSDMISLGDDQLQGHMRHHWELLAPSLARLTPSEVVKTESVCSSGTEKQERRSNSAGFSCDDGQDDQRDGSNAKTAPLFRRVFKVYLTSYRSEADAEARRKRRMSSLSRLGVSKQIFESFINRLIGYNYPTPVGLVTFGTTTSIAQPLTHIVENFRRSVDNMYPSGDTCLWDALALAADQLIHFGMKHPGATKRIICLSDGCDNKSKKLVSDVCQLLVQNGIVVDSCSIGTEDSSELRAVSYLTGGYKFSPESLEQAVAICEMEPVLSQHERPTIVHPVIPALLTRWGFFLAIPLAETDVVNRDIFPARKTHPRLEDQFVRAVTFNRMSTAIPARSSGSDRTTPSILRSRRLLTEIQNMVVHPHPSYDVYVSESNVGFWKVVLSGPAESAYSDGTFVLYLDMGDNYPRMPPQGRFTTPIFHPNINHHGRICHSIFDRNWTVDTTNRQVLDTVFGLLLVPEFTDPINTIVTLNFYWDEVAFRDEVAKHIRKHAVKGREEWEREILGDTARS